MQTHDTLLNSDPGTRLTDAEVALLASAGFFNFLADGRAFISPKNLRTAILIPNTDARTPDEIAKELTKPFVIQLGSNFFTLTFRGAGGPSLPLDAIFSIRRAAANETAAFLQRMNDPLRAEAMAQKEAEIRAAAGQATPVTAPRRQPRPWDLLR